MSKKVETQWSKISIPVHNRLKIYLLKHYVADIIHFYSGRISMIVSKYSKYLPRYVVDSEIDDLKTVAQLEFLETLKVWDPEKHEKVWPLAQSRMLGAMKDHIRYITRTDPSRMYDWVTEAAHMYQAVESNSGFESKFDTGDQLNMAMKVLTEREKVVVIQHTKADLTFKAIGEQIGVSESQVSRIYKKALEKLKKAITAQKS